MKVKELTGVLCAALMGSGGALWADTGPLSVLPPDAANSCTVAEDEFDAEWVKLQFPTTDTNEGNPLRGNVIGPFYDIDSGLVYVFPFDGPGLTETYNKDEDNCTFFKWSSQMFYWLTSTIQDGKMNVPPTDPVEPSADTKYVFANEFFYHVIPNADGSGLELIPQDEVHDQTTVLNARASKGNPDPSQSADGVDQARSSGVLFTHASTDVSSDGGLVYYSVHANRSYGYIKHAQLNENWLEKLIFNWDEFPDDHHEICMALYYGLFHGFIDITDKFGILSLAMIDVYCPIKELNSFAAGLERFVADDFPEIAKLLEEMSGGLNPANLPAIENLIPFVEPAVDYLSMAMEVKASWVPASTLTNPEGFIRHMGYIPVTSEDGDGNLVETGDYDFVELALLGMHVVGSVAGHPEMIWATFEHYSNAPSEAYAYVDANGDTKSWNDLDQLGDSFWLLNNGDTSNPNADYAVFHAEGSKKEGGGTWDANTIAKASSDQSEPVTQASNVMRLSPWGSATGDASATVNTEVISTNRSVHENFVRFYGGKDLAVHDVRTNYLLTGAVWGKVTADSGPVFPTSNDPSMLTGTPEIANMTMETFAQTFEGSVNTSGCFGCHGIPAGADKFNVSHIYVDITAVQKNK